MIGRFGMDRIRTNHEGGFTLVEMMVAMMILGLVLSAVYAVLSRAQISVNSQVNRSTNQDNISVAMNEISSEVTSAGAITVTDSSWNPVSGSTNGANLIVYTQNRANTRPSGFTCVQWRVAGTGNGSPFLEYREWPLNWSSDPSTLVGPWIRETNYVQQTRSGTPEASSKTYFSLVGGGTAYGARLLSVHITVDTTPDYNNNSGTLSVAQQMNGWNVQFDPPNNTNPCLVAASLPADSLSPA
jgi:prepilin-type N-terminal cleavage/methylation domain-containing protein